MRMQSRIDLDISNVCTMRTPRKEDDSIQTCFDDDDEVHDQRAVYTNRLLQRQVYALTKDYTLAQIEEVQRILRLNAPRTSIIHSQLQRRTKIGSGPSRQKHFAFKTRQRAEELDQANFAFYSRLERVRSAFASPRSPKRIPKISPHSRLLGKIE
eukprot:GEMP01104617.1.p1 GENE.GEMP01104617.1~~GEMP01104617.1.p1  ORF type:complete len:182 (+),score=21.56 GEMP01104617.1:83-547(+)